MMYFGNFGTHVNIRVYPCLCYPVWGVEVGWEVVWGRLGVLILVVLLDLGLCILDYVLSI